MRDAAQAKSRIAVYGDSSVISALAKFEDLGAVLNNAQSNAPFVDVVSMMRRSMSKSSIQRAEMERLLLGSRRD
jgi:hypothetical protein